jgi:voltage-gated potassium channel Kch
VVFDSLSPRKISWHWYAALILFLSASVGFTSGVGLTGQPDIVDAPFVVKAYYSMGLFVVGGLDIGTPVGGPLYGRILLWIAFFGSPLLAASAVIEAVLRVMSPQRWRLRRLRNHIVIVGSGDMTLSYLRVLRSQEGDVRVVVVDQNIDRVRELELTETFDVTVVVGDITQEFLIKSLRLKRSQRVMLLGEDNFLAFEAASKILKLHPHLESRIILHCSNLRFLRAMQDTRIANQCISFNSYNLAAKGLVREVLLHHFHRTKEKDVVILAGFGRFGQTILEELQLNAHKEIASVGIMDVDADRRIQIVDEQERFTSDYSREVFEGNIAHPEVWRNITRRYDLSLGEPVIILGTGDSANNLRTALWIRKKFPRALLFVRTNLVSEFAREVCEEHNIQSISITQLVEDNIPVEWLN